MVMLVSAPAGASVGSSSTRETTASSVRWSRFHCQCGRSAAAGLTRTRASSDLCPSARNFSSGCRIASRRGRISSSQRLFGFPKFFALVGEISSRTLAWTSNGSPVTRESSSATSWAVKQRMGAIQVASVRVIS